ncbi:MAG: hypothetical protein GQ542_17055, partial [Desulforhopalus sp.]|nr:hypothetical protein [Desulforhopalus sp.]
MTRKAPANLLTVIYSPHLSSSLVVHSAQRINILKFLQKILSQLGTSSPEKRNVTSDLNKELWMSRHDLGPGEPKQEPFPPWLLITAARKKISSSPKNDVSLTRYKTVRSKWFQLVMHNARECFLVELSTYG